MPGVAGWLRAWGAPDGAAGSASGRWSEGGGEAEPADQRLQVTVRAAVPPDRGVRARGDGGQRVAQDRPGRRGRGGIAALRRLDDRGEEPEAGRGLLRPRRPGRAGGAASRARPRPGRRGPRRAGRSPSRAARTRRQPARLRQRRRCAGVLPTTAAGCASPRTTGTGRAGDAAAPAAAGHPDIPAPGRAPTGAAARRGMTGRRARRTPGPRTRPPRRCTAASGRSFPVTAPRSPAVQRGNSCCRFPARAVPRNPDQVSPAETTR